MKGLKRFEVNYRIISKGGKVMVVHHNHLKQTHISFQAGEPVCPSREVEEFQMVDVTPDPTNRY